MSYECVKLAVGLVIFMGIGDVVFIPLLGTSTWDVRNLKECFKNKEISLNTNTGSNI